MNKVVGKVLVKETGVGVPDLVVVLFDSDPQPTTSTSPSGAPAVLSGAGGDRIGSVMTDAKGSFEFAFDSTAFAASDPEKRPDLVLGVFAPEDSQSSQDPTPLPPNQRLLVFSNVVRLNAGGSEAYVLRVPRAQLSRFGIQFPGSRERSDLKQHADRVVTAYISREELTKHIRDGLAPMRKARLQQHREITTAAKKLVRKLGATPLKVRQFKTFVGPDNDLQTAQRAAMKRGLEAIKKMTPARPFVYEITQEDMAAGGLATPGVIWSPAPLYDELTHEQLCRIIGRRRGGMALERVKDLVGAQASEAEAKRRLDLMTAPEADGDGQLGGAPDEVPSLLSSAEAITTGVLGQLTDLTAPTAKPAATIEELSARLMGFALPPGPADITSFHDFHELQIAFEHVWTEAFDEGLKERIRLIFEDNLHEEFGHQFDSLTEVSEMFDVEELLADMQGVQSSRDTEAPGEVQDYLPEAAQRWSLFSELQKAELILIALDLGGVTLPDYEHVMLEDPVQLHARALAIIAQPAGRGGRLTRLLDETRQRLSEPYAFHYFAPNSVNFGILLTYRQKWEPLTYQVGDLVSTIPLAPGEVRRFSSKTVIKRTRAQKELEKSLSSRSGESTLTQRADAEITEKASSTTNFKHTAQGSFNFGIGNLEATAEFVLSQAQESASVKKSFREAVIKAASEYKQERALEIETTQESTVETSTSGEIANTNNEMTVTYLLYELERQYRISERIHRVMPVILVAQDVPGPHEITESWLLAHEWILRRVMLDDGLAPALDQLKESFAGDELALGIKKANWESQKGIVEKLEAAVSGLISSRDALRQTLLNREEAKALVRAAEDAQGFLMDFAEELTVDVGEGIEGGYEARIKTIKKELEFVQESLSESQQKLATAQEALGAATREYTGGIEAQTNRRVAIDQLRVHVKENILYYMQAIWDHEPPDQRFFRLYWQTVDLPEAAISTCRLRRATDEELTLGVETICRQGNYYVVEGCDAPQLPDPDHPNTKQLVEIADLDHPLGYKGNYIIFPLKTCVYLTEFMMKDFMDGYLGVRDPDAAANYTTDELLTYLENIWADPTITLSDQEREAAVNLATARVREPRRESDIVIVPTGQLYIEALLGSHPLLEPFKQIHRAYDVGKARAELRRAELDNLRRAARLLREEPDLDDPDIDKRVVIEGVTPNVVVENG